MFKQYFLENILCIALILFYFLFTVDDIIKKQISKISLAISTLVLGIMCVYTFAFSPAFVVGPSMNPTLHSGEILFINKADKNCKRFDIAVFYSENLKKSLIKRIVGLPGDTIEFKDAKLYVNKKLVEQNFTKVDSYADYGPVTIPDEHYFMIGDNRPHSMDSRYSSVGFVSKESIKGIVFTQK